MRSSYVAALACALALGACAPGGATDGPSAASPATTATPTPSVEQPTVTADGALTTPVLESAMLTLDDLPGSFEIGTLEAGTPGDAGCLSLIDDLDALGAETVTRVRFLAEGETGAAGVLSKAYSDGDPAVLAAGLDGFLQALRDCRGVDTDDDDGATADLEITVSRRLSSPLAERQVTFVASGTVSGGGTSYPYRIKYTVSLLGRVLAVLAASEVGDLGTGVVGEQPRLDDLLLERLVDAGATP